MRKIVAWIISICVFPVSLAYSTTASPISPVPNLYYIKGQSSTSLSFDPANDLIVVNATVNGKGPFRFLLDTGASHNVMTPELARSLGLKVEGGGTIDAGGQAKVSAGLARVDEVGIGEFTLERQSFFVLPFPASYMFQGFLGAEVFKRFIVRIDFRRSLLTLTVPYAFRYRGDGAVLQIKFHEGLIPQVKAEVDGHAGWFKLDTGYNGSLALFGKFIDEHDLLAKYGPQKSGAGARTLTGEVNNVLSTQIREFKLGDLMLGRILTSFFLEREGSNSNFAGAIGTGILKQFNVIINYDKQRVILESK
jgi:predicted aspartyl protease